MDFEDLRVFAVVARLQSFSRAAAQLNIAQSALSRRVQRLEYQFGMTLLERHSRGAKPTEAGLVLLTKVERLECEIRQVQRDMLVLKDSVRGEMRLALPHGVIQFLAASIIERYRQRCPHVRLSVVEGKSSSNHQAVVDGTVDAAMMYDPDAGPEVAVVPVLWERRLVISPVGPGQDHAGIRHLAQFAAAQLATLPLILPARPHHLRAAVDAAASRCGITLNVALEIDGLSALIAMVKSGLGYTVLPYGPAHLDIAAGALAAVPIVDPVLECMVGLLYRTDRQGSDALLRLVEVIMDVVRASGQNTLWRPAAAGPAAANMSNS